MTTFVTWQLRVTLDSIRNSCDVFFSKLFLTEKCEVLLSAFPALRMYGILPCKGKSLKLPIMVLYVLDVNGMLKIILFIFVMHWNDGEALILNSTKAPSCDFSSLGHWPMAEEWMVKVGEGYYYLHSPFTHTTHMLVIFTHKVQISFLPTSGLL